MSTLRTVLAVLLASIFAVLIVSCSGDDDDKKKETKAITTPEFVRTSTAAPPTIGSAPPPVIIGSGPGATSLVIGGPINLGPAASTSTATATGLTVRHVETATVNADRAFVVAQMQAIPSGPGPFTPSISGRQQEQVTTALTGLGVKKEDIFFETAATYGPFATITVAVDVKELQSRGRQFVDAIETAVGSRPQSGARFALSDCRTALDPLRKKAIDATNEQAKSIAAASSLTLGPIRSMTQTLNQASYGGPASDPCASGGTSPGPRPPGAMLALDSEPRVSLNLQIEATYSLGSGDTTGGLSVSGSGKATAKAGEAYIVVVVYASSAGPFGPPPVSKKSRDELTAKLKALKYAEDDIQVDNALNGPGQIIVSVEVPVADVQKANKDIIAAVEETIGRSQNSGVWYSHNNCAAVLAEARKQAIADAKRNAEALAGSASVKLGSLTSISEGGPSGVPVSPYANAASTDPCTDNIALLFQAGVGASVGLKSFDAPAEFTVTSNIAVTYAIQP